MKVESGIYKIENIVDGKKYIGSAVDLNKRKNVHYSSLRNNKHHSIYLQNAFNLYGELNFIFEIVELIDDKDLLLSREQFYIDTMRPQYNICKTAGSWLNNKHSEKTKSILRHKTKNANKKICVYCNVEMHINNLTRWHNEHCLLNPNIDLDSERKYRASIQAGISKKKQERGVCLYCKEELAINIISRYHNEKCIANPNISKEEIAKRIAFSLKMSSVTIGRNKGQKRTKEFCDYVSEDKIYKYRNGILTHPFKGRKHRDESNEKNRESQLKLPKILCPHCDVLSNKGNFNRWHGDKCKYKI